MEFQWRDTAYLFVQHIPYCHSFHPERGCSIVWENFRGAYSSVFPVNAKYLRETYGKVRQIFDLE